VKSDVVVERLLEGCQVRSTVEITMSSWESSCIRYALIISHYQGAQFTDRKKQLVEMLSLQLSGRMHQLSDGQVCSLFTFCLFLKVIAI
jgi:hypothetical protein